MAKESFFSKGEKRLLIFVSAFVIIILAITCWEQANNVTPVIHVPPALAMPSPNARDDYRKAYNAFVPYNIATSTTPYPLSFSNLEMDYGSSTFGTGPGIAASIAKEAAGNAAGPRAGQNSNAPQPSLAELRELVRLNESTFAALHAGFHHEFREPPMRSFFAPGNPTYAYYRSLARRIAIAAQVKRMSGDWNGAANMSLDGIRIGSDIPRGAGMLGMLVGDAIQAIERTSLEETIDHLNAAQARRPHGAWKKWTVAIPPSPTCCRRRSGVPRRPCWTFSKSRTGTAVFAHRFIQRR